MAETRAGYAARETGVTIEGWRGRRVFVTGHTGFKGGWLCLLLAELGADVTGFALAPATEPNLFESAGIAATVTSVIGDVRDAAAVRSAMAAARPEIVFHLAAQPLVRYSYDHPVETYATNVMGTVHVLEAARQIGGVRAIVAVTSDKCYENREWVWPYRESDPIGGHDPYSSSKGAAELVIAAYRRSYFDGARGPALASVRAGNVIGGGDWSADRLIPDIVRAFQAARIPVIRAPRAVRPWQHVLEALGGYVMIADRLFAGDAAFADAWNFGPAEEDTRPVGWIVDRMARAWGAPSDYADWTGPAPHEAGLLTLDTAKARAALGWRPIMRLADAIDSIVAWHKAVHAGDNARDITLGQIRSYLSKRSKVPA